MKKRILSLLLLMMFVSNAAPVFAINDAVPIVQSETAVLLDAATGQILYQKDMDKRMYPASITKIVTGMLALQSGDLSDMITLSGDAVDAVEKDSANIALSAGEEITMEQALYAISIASANDAANGIGEMVGGSLDHFVDMMNEVAQEAGALNTHFSNANGLPDANHYTTAHDMALMTAKALDIKGFTEIFGAKRYKIPPTNKQPETRIVNSSNRFLNGDMPYDGILISKAGWTVDAQHTLVTAAQRNGVTLVAVVMKSSDSTVKWADTKALLDYGFNQFSYATLDKSRIISALPQDIALTGQDSRKIDPARYEVQNVTLLVPLGLSPDDIQISLGNPQLGQGGNGVTIPVRLSIPSTSQPTQSDVLFESEVKANLMPAAVTVQTQPKPRIGVLKVILLSLAVLIGVLLVAFVVLVIRREIIVRKRRQKRQLQKRRTDGSSSYSKDDLL